ncbi:hypothetical protein, partial [Treponema sp. R6D11]
TFGAGNRALRSNDPCPKCGGTKACRGRSPNTLLCSLAPKGRTFTDLLCEVVAYTIVILHLQVP